MGKTAKKSTSMSLDAGVLEEARRLGINVSQAAESGVVSAIQAERAKEWGRANAGAIADYNAMIEKDGIPLAEFRVF
jgi:antitoxin CcdA